MPRNGRVQNFVLGTDPVVVFLDRSYHKPYMNTGRKVWGIGLNYNPEKDVRGIDDPVVGELG